MQVCLLAECAIVSEKSCRGRVEEKKTKKESVCHMFLNFPFVFQCGELNPCASFKSRV